MNANRMTLTKTRRRLAMARRGHVLMKHKLEELIHLFQAEVGGYAAAQEDVARLLREVYAYHALDGATAAPGPRLRTTVRVETGHLLNLKVPVVTGTVTMETPPYGLLETSADCDRSVLRLQEALPHLLRLAQVQRRIELLLHEIEVTRRRVNALEYVLVPQLAHDARLIQMKLDEMERGNVSRLMRIKAIIRKEA